MPQIAKFLICIFFCSNKNEFRAFLLISSSLFHTVSSSPSSPVCGSRCGVIAGEIEERRRWRHRSLQATPGRTSASAGCGIEARADLQWQEAVLRRHGKWYPRILIFFLFLVCRPPLSRSLLGCRWAWAWLATGCPGREGSAP